MTLMQIQVGDQFDHYQIRAQMAQGGMSTVYRANDLLTGKDVVLKIPDQMLIGDPGQYERFQRELDSHEYAASSRPFSTDSAAAHSIGRRTWSPNWSMAFRCDMIDQ